MSFPFLQLFLNSLIIGSIYALVACGFSLIYATNRFVHFAHGASVTVAAYFTYAMAVKAGLPFWLSIFFTVIFAGLFGAAIYQFIYAPLQKKKSSNVILLIASVGLLILFENVVLLIFGADVKSYRQIDTPTIYHIGSASITLLQVIIIVITLILLLALFLFMKKTLLGKRMRAVADNKELAIIMGINAKRIALISFIIGTTLAGVAGVLIGLEQNLEPTMGTQLMIKGFTGAVIGGVTSVPASILGSFILGVAENFGIWYLPSGYKDAIAFGLLFIFLIWRPHGLLGLNKGVRK
jgi:branched-chain amino acid transport system permease protein